MFVQTLESAYENNPLTVGKKAEGLLRVPIDWRPRSFLVGRQIASVTGLRLAELEHLLRQEPRVGELLRLAENIGGEIIIRSNATDETLLQRGLYASEVC